MAGLVQRRQKKFSRGQSVVPRVIHYSAPAKIIRRFSSFFLILWLVIVFVFIFKYIFQSTIFSSDFVIQSVRYDSGSVSLFDEPALYSTISKNLQGKNYYWMRLFGKGDVFDAVQQEFPMVLEMDIFFLEKNTAAVSLRFDDPLMLVIAWERKFAVYDALNILPLYPQNTLWQGTMQLTLADYASGMDTLDGLFFRIPPQVLFEQLLIFDTYFKKPYSVVYFPGVEKTQITAADGKVLYINNLSDINLQLGKIDLLKKHYADFDSLWQFDLGSLDADTVIVKK
jgi:hypothetical protein